MVQSLECKYAKTGGGNISKFLCLSNCQIVRSLYRQITYFLHFQRVVIIMVKEPFIVNAYLTTKYFWCLNDLTTSWQVLVTIMVKEICSWISNCLKAKLNNFGYLNDLSNFVTITDDHNGKGNLFINIKLSDVQMKYLWLPKWCL